MSSAYVKVRPTGSRRTFCATHINQQAGAWTAQSSRWGRDVEIATLPVVRSSAGAGLLPIGRDINTSQEFFYAIVIATV